MSPVTDIRFCLGDHLIDGIPIFTVTSICHQHMRVRGRLKLPKDFVVHSLRHTMLTRLGEAGADTFTIKRIAGHSSVTVTERYVHPTPEGLERDFERLERFNVAAQNDIHNGNGNEKEEITRQINAENWPQRQAVPTVSTTVN
jgi:hypothetical protein